MNDKSEIKDNKDKRKTVIAFIVLQAALLLVSVGAICSKFAGREPFLSFRFILFYGLLLAILFVYAIIWQQVLKYLPLTVAYACKGFGIFYGMIWGALVFEEEITPKMIIGAVVVLIGVYIFVFSNIGNKTGGGEK